jgi:hypothetical protein
VWQLNGNKKRNHKIAFLALWLPVLGRPRTEYRESVIEFVLFYQKVIVEAVISAGSVYL